MSSRSANDRRWGRVTSDELLILLATRLRSRGSADAIGRTFVELGGDESFDVVAALAGAESLGQVKTRGEEGRRSLTAAGSAELAAYLAAETDAVGRADIMTAYRAFLPINREFLSVVASVDDPSGRLVLLRDLVARLTPVLHVLRTLLHRFHEYSRRFERSLAAARDDAAWIDAAGIDSVHTIWFELHEHLLATLGRERVGER